jgi:hypothetical protein
MNTHERSDRHKAKREGRKKRRLVRHVQSQLRQDLPKLSITCDEGVAITVQEQARRILGNYYNRKLIQFYETYHYVLEGVPRTLPGCHDADAAYIAAEQIRMAVVPPWRKPASRPVTTTLASRASIPGSPRTPGASTSDSPASSAGPSTEYAPTRPEWPRISPVPRTSSIGGGNER